MEILPQQAHLHGTEVDKHEVLDELDLPVVRRCLAILQHVEGEPLQQFLSARQEGLHHIGDPDEAQVREALHNWRHAHREATTEAQHGLEWRVGAEHELAEELAVTQDLLGGVVLRVYDLVLALRVAALCRALPRRTKVSCCRTCLACPRLVDAWTCMGLIAAPQVPADTAYLAFSRIRACTFSNLELTYDRRPCTHGRREGVNVNLLAEVPQLLGAHVLELDGQALVLRQLRHLGGHHLAATAPRRRELHGG
ncbi:hypothetical protein ON010_g10605 [Phytophthora cinnamomi]|nr:hypothetical protein ON010_g10605 [Phytophthora cinnamomi]